MKFKIILVLLIPFILNAQQIPAPHQSHPIIFMGATAHLGNGEVIESSIIGFKDGKYSIIGNIAMAQGFHDYEIIQANGFHIYPGLIAPNTFLGLKEIDAVRATRDFDELGNFNPNLNSIYAYNTDSRVTPTIRSNGVLIAQIIPSGGRISGQSSIVQLDAWNWEDALIKSSDGIHLNWPSYFSRKGWYGVLVEKNINYQKQIDELQSYFEEAHAYSKTQNHEKTNLKFVAMNGLFDKSKKIYVHTDFVKSIKDAVLFLKQFDLDVVIVGGYDAWRIPKFLKEYDISIILTNIHQLPHFPDEDIYQPFLNPKILSDNEVKFAFAIDGMWQQRNLPFHAGQAVSFGLDSEKAIQAMTLDAAKILGIDNKVGSIEVGKDATFIISIGNILDMKSSKIIYAFINGREIDLDNKQKVLYRKYQKKYNHVIQK